MTRKSELMCLNVAHFFDHFFLLVFPTAVIAIESDWELTYGEALALGTPLYVAFAVATLPSGWLGDHFSRQKLMTSFFLGCGGRADPSRFVRGSLEAETASNCAGDARSATQVFICKPNSSNVPTSEHRAKTKTSRRPLAVRVSAHRSNHRIVSCAQTMCCSMLRRRATRP